MGEDKKKKKSMFDRFSDNPSEDITTEINTDESRVMAEPSIPLDEPKVEKVPVTPPQTVKNLEEPGTKKMLDSNPTMLRKHKSIMNQKNPSSRKYFQSR